MSKYTFYEVVTSKTRKPAGRPKKGEEVSIGDNGYRRFDDTREVFNTLEEVKAHLHDTYGHCKRVKVYQDTAKGDSIHTGYIYCFRVDSWGNEPDYYEQDWVTVYKTTREAVIV